jgi:hypothetical protein
MKLVMAGRELLHYEFSVPSDSLVMADGTIWSHAATLGTRFKGDAFSIDRDVVENFVKVFTSGYPRKVPVDYEHASTTDDPEVRKLRAKGEVPKAGDVAELRGVFSAADFTGDLGDGSRPRARCNRSKPASTPSSRSRSMTICRTTSTDPARAPGSGPSRSSTRRSSTTCFPWPHRVPRAVPRRLRVHVRVR